MLRTTAFRGVLGLGALAAAAAFAAPAAAQGYDNYVRATIGYDFSTAATLLDTDCTAGAPLPALFGCGDGIDGLPTGAYGDFGNSAFFEFGLGAYATPGIRVESTIAYRGGLAFAGNSNFTGSGTSQPTSATVSQLTFMNFLYVDFLELMGVESRFQPFVGAGIGVARNEIGEYRIDLPIFDGINDSYRLGPGGVNWSFAWTLTAGVGFRVNDRTTVEFAYRYNHLGTVETDTGELFVQPGGADGYPIAINSLFAPLSSHALTLSVRFDF